MAIQSDVFLISEYQLKDSGYIDENISGKALRMAIIFAQDDISERYLGTRLSDKLKYLILNDEIKNEENEHYKYLLDTFIYKGMIFAVCAEIILRENMKVRNKGLISTSDDYVTNASLNDTIWNIKDATNKANEYFIRMAKYIRCNIQIYPEANESIGTWEREQTDKTDYHSNFHFRNRGCKKSCCK